MAVGNKMVESCNWLVEVHLLAVEWLANCLPQTHFPSGSSIRAAPRSLALVGAALHRGYWPCRALSTPQCRLPEEHPEPSLEQHSWELA